MLLAIAAGLLLFSGVLTAIDENRLHHSLLIGLMTPSSEVVYTPDSSKTAWDRFLLAFSQSDYNRALEITDYLNDSGRLQIARFLVGRVLLEQGGESVLYNIDSRLRPAAGVYAYHQAKKLDMMGENATLWWKAAAYYAEQGKFIWEAALALRKQQEMQPAIDAFRRAGQSDDLPDWQKLLAQALAAEYSGDLTKAANWYKEGLVINPCETRLRLGLARTISKRYGDSPEAILDVLLPSDCPPDAAVLIEIGRVYREKEDWTASVIAYQEALTLAPKSYEAILGLGITYVEMGQDEQAIELLSEATILRPEDPRGHYHLGRAFEAQHKLSQAIAAYAQAISLSPNPSWYCAAYQRICTSGINCNPWSEMVAQKCP